jgi:hypothetical protein
VQETRPQVQETRPQVQETRPRVRETRPRVRHARPRVRVQPRYPYRRWHSPYPVPYAFEYPGPGAVRHCVNRYVTEYRRSGAVVVPRMHCWWSPG